MQTSTPNKMTLSFGLGKADGNAINQKAIKEKGAES